MLGSQTQTSPKEPSRLSSEKARIKSRYFMTWRWHFYAGLYVIPFLLMLSLTGLVMLFDDEIEQARYQDELIVMPESSKVPVSQQLESVQASYPSGQVTQYIPAAAANLVNKFSVRLEDGTSVFTTVNPYSGQVLGEIDRSDSWYQLANEIHGTLLVGQWGDYLIEVSASLSILLLVTGIYLWLPRDKASKAGFLKVRFTSGTRILMRDLHANLGGVLSVVLLFFVISGLAWAGVWGSKLVQAWNTFPTYYTWGDKPESLLTHADLNHGSEEEMPWNLEQAPLPESTGHAHGSEDHAHHEHSSYDISQSISIDSIVEQAQRLGFTQFNLFLPQSETGVYTLAANSMAGDISDPRKDKTTHIDQYTGEVLVDVTWEDYSLFAKFMAAGVSLHQGDVSVVNKILNVLFCVAFIVISITGIVMWWIRRPSGKTRVGIPPRFESDGIWKVGAITLAMVAVFFPLAAVTIVLFGVIDWFVFRQKVETSAA
ncbi:MULTISPECIES: PepSY-associated TM helix domain-containing protein [Vibrio]|uniref:PepSY-associated TM helix domain-containing protein n=1 Tax=Vibrio TaxID=662 RepID=UPI0020750969|nr:MULTISPECIES: PepSY domain-containing protein [Vibrio]USD35114.1 PepSY domain-containing protein [Vibrio sp. SCSIO 43186]USD48180.1 PepSY domain-containing protein [Vibrio sp. SCSIO 43145]USD72239.1 PepSY domain-containing protein [Vibrio sp. SCSIO 43139]USD97914.1 hypothetical protein CTT30_17815 [Vibrio coralliilyticus]